MSKCTQFPDLVVSMDAGGLGIRTICTNVPRKRNAITRRTFIDIADALAEARDDPATVITVLTGTGDYFSSGNDLSNFSAAMAEAQTLDEMSESGGNMLEQFVSAFIEFPKILVALVNGPAVGVAVTVLGLADLVYATEDAHFTTPFAKLGQAPEACSSYTFPRLFGRSVAMELFCLARPLPAEEARAAGLVTKTFPGKTFADDAMKEVEALARMPKQSIRTVKELVRRWDTDTLRRANREEVARLKKMWTSDECLEAIADFFNSRAKL